MPTGNRTSSPGFALLGTVQTCLILTLTAIAVPLPDIGREYGLDRAGLILLNAAYGLAFAGLLLFGGRLADRYGGRRVLTAGLLLFAAASLAAPLAPGYPALLAARYAQGAGAALVAPAAMAVLRTLFPQPAEYGRAVATWGGLSVLGATAGNLLSGVATGLASWRWTFAAPLLVATGALLLAPRLLPADPGRPAGRRAALDLPGAALATTGITLAGYGLVLTDAHPWTSAAVGLPLLTAAAVLGAFLLTELHTRDPLLPPRFLLRPRRAIALTAIGLTAAATAITFVLLSLHLQQARGWTPLETSGAFLPFAVTLIAAGRAAGPLIGRFGARTVTTGGLAGAAAGLALLAATGLNTALPYPVGLLPGLVLLPAGAAASFAGAVLLAVEGVPQRRAGLAGGVMNTAMELGPTVVLAVLLSFGSDAASLALTGAALAATAVATLLRPNTEVPEHPSPEESHHHDQSIRR
ncbi:MFS transporter [Kitasatospora sp. NPDC057223]|uniref:MFS transporter n=1 Tax=Kitasatospora sp. NPDC057223 TaxID=3346055 RepID=UPI0036445B35